MDTANNYTLAEDDVTAYSPQLGFEAPIEQTGRTRSEHVSDHFTFGVPAAVAGFADTVGQSVGLLDENELANYMQEQGGDFGKYYYQNQEGARFAGDLVGMFVPGMAAVKAIRAGSLLQRTVGGMTKSRLVNSVFTSGKSYERVMRGVRLSHKYAARAHERNLATEGMEHVRVVGLGGKADDAVSLDRFTRRAYQTKMGDAAKEAVTFEVGVAATMGASETLYPEEMSMADVAIWNGMVPAAFVGIEGAFLRHMVRASMTKAGKEIPAFTSGTIYSELPGERSYGLTVNSLTAQELRGQQAAAKELELSGKSSGRSRAQLTNINKELLELQAQEKSTLSKMAKDAVVKEVTVPTRLTDSQLNHLATQLEADPYLMVGAQSIESGAEGGKALLERAATRRANLEKEIAELGDVAAMDEKAINKFANAQAELTRLNELEFFMVEADGSLTAATRRSKIYQDNDKFLNGVDQKTSGTLGQTVWSVKAADGKLNMLSNGVFEVQAGKNALHQMSVEAQTATHALVQRTAAKIKLSADSPMKLTSQSSFPTWELAETLIERNGGRLPEGIELPEGISTFADVQFANLAAKYDHFVKLRNHMDKIAEGKVKLKATQKTSVEDIHKILNLPAGYGGEVHPLINVFEAFRMQGDTALADAVENLDHLQAMMKADEGWGLTAEGVERGLEVRGKMHEWMPDYSPVALVKKPIDSSVYNRRGQMEMAQQIEAHKQSVLLGAQNTAVGKVAQIMGGTDSQVKNVDSLVDGGLGNTAVTQAAFAARENVAVQSAHTLETMTERVMRTHASDMFQPHNLTFSKLRDTNNAADMRMLETFIHASRQGWDIAEEPVEVAGGKFGFKLLKTDRNKQRLMKHHGVELDDDTLMPTPFEKSSKPLVLTGLAMEGATALNTLGRDVFDNLQVLRKASTGGSGQRRNWWVPPVNFARTDVVHLVSSTGEYLRTVAGRTYKDALKQAESEIADLAAQGTTGVMRVDHSNLEKYHKLQDEVFERMADFSDPLAQTGAARGTSVGTSRTLVGTSLNDAIESINRSYESIGRRTRVLMLENEINKVRMQVGSLTAGGKETGDTMQQAWLGAVYGNPTMNPNDIVGKLYYGIESVYDQALQKMYDSVSGWKLPDVQAKALGKSEAERTFDSLNDKLGEYNPFSSAADMLAKEHRVAVPSSMRRHMAKLNGAVSTLTLRFMEVGHATLNMVSLASTAPAVVKALTRKPGQAQDEWLESIGAWGSAVTDSHVDFDGVRATTSGIHHMFTEEGKKAIETAEKMGLLDQDVAEIVRTLHNPMEVATERNVRKAIDKLSWLSDKSEKLSRAVAFSIGHKLASSNLGISKWENQAAFAHRFANDVIGDYRSVNRPKMFQGAVGMPLGLFQTFTWNFYQRLFKYVEQRDLKALGVQAAAQAAVFGGESVPGFDMFNNFFFSNYDGTVNPAEKFRKLYGDTVTDVVMYGSLSNLPKMFGQDGIGLYSRGDLNVQRVPGLWSLDKTPIYRLFETRINTLKQLAQAANNEGLSTQRVAEILSINSMNRTLRNVAEITSGVSLTKRGEIVDDDTREFWDIATRAVGMRTMRETKLRNAIYQNKAAQYSRTAKRQQLADTLRSAFRGGNLDEGMFERAIQLYIGTGGNPEDFGTYVQQQAMMSLVDRGSRDIIKYLGNPSKSHDLWRMMSALGMSETDPEFE